MADGVTQFPLKVLFVDDEIDAPGAAGRAGRALVEDVRARGYDVVTSASAEDGISVIGSDPLIGCLVADWDLAGGDPKLHTASRDVLTAFRARNDEAPVFLIGERSQASDIPLDMLQLADDFIWLLEDTPTFITGRIEAAIRRYGQGLLPPMFQALVDYGRIHAYAWCTPGHTGGTAFLKTPAARVFYDYFGEHLFRADLSISMGELGSLLDHSGPIGEGEQYAARVFG